MFFKLVSRHFYNITSKNLHLVLNFFFEKNSNEELKKTRYPSSFVFFNFENGCIFDEHQGQNCALIGSQR